MLKGAFRLERVQLIQHSPSTLSGPDRDRSAVAVVVFGRQLPGASIDLHHLDIARIDSIEHLAHDTANAAAQLCFSGPAAGPAALPPERPRRSCSSTCRIRPRARSSPPGGGRITFCWPGNRAVRHLAGAVAEPAAAMSGSFFGPM